MPSHAKILWRTLWYGRAAECHRHAAVFLLYIYLFKNKWKALNTLFNSAEHTITRERVFLFPCLKVLLGHSNRWTLCNHHEPSCGIRSSLEGRDILAVSPFPFHPLRCKQIASRPERRHGYTRALAGSSNRRCEIQMLTDCWVVSANTAFPPLEHRPRIPSPLRCV